MNKLAIPEAVLKQHVAVLGKTGSGKTSTAKLLIEKAVDEGSRVCILDPVKSDWWGLTSSESGKRAGLPFQILGGPRGHVPLHPGAGRAIGELVATGALPLSIIDMADFPAGGLSRFFTEFAESLFKRMRGVLYLVIEEAHEFAPKERLLGDENMMIHWAKKIATAGRKKGLRLVLVTQRVQALHNALLGSCDTLIAHRLIAPADQKPVIDWLKANVAKSEAQTAADSLSSLKTGEGWIVSGEAKIFEAVQFPRIRTFDNTATPDASDDELDVKTAPVDVDKLREVIGDALKDAEANDPKALRAEIQRLKLELEKKPRQAESPPPQVREVQVPLITQTERAVLHGLAATLKDARESVTPAIDIVEQLHARLTDFENHKTDVMRELSRATATTIRLPIKQAAPSPRPPATVNGGSFVVTTTQQRILDALAWFESIGIEAPTSIQIGAVAMIDGSGGHFSNVVGPLSTNGLVERGNGTTRLTAAGREIARVPEGAGTLGGYHNMLKQRVGRMKTASRKTVEILDVIIRNGPREITTAAIGERAGIDHTGGHFSNTIGPLGTLKLIERHMGTVRPTEILFPPLP
jgi:hypothetical protein